MADQWPDHPADDMTVSGENAAWPDHPASEVAPAPPAPPDFPWYSRAAYGLADPMVGLVQLGGHLIGAGEGVDKLVGEREQRYQQQRDTAGQTGTDLVRLGGNIASPVNFVPAAAAGRAATLGRAALTGAESGALTSMAQPVTNGQDFFPVKAEQAGTGAALGAGLGAVAPTLLPGLTPAAQTMRAIGVEPTPGAAAGRLPAVIEDLWGRLPVLGAPVQAGRTAAREQFDKAIAGRADALNRDAVNYALSPIGESLGASTKTGSDAIAEMAQKASAAYDAAVPAAGAPIDTTATTAMRDARNNLALRAPDRLDQFDNFLQAKLVRPTGGGASRVLPGQAYKDFESDLGGEAQRLLTGNSSSDERALGQAYRDVQGALRDNLARNNPQSADAITAANETWKRMLPIQDASASDLQNATFTAQQLASSARKFAGRTRYARGQAPMQDFAQNAMDANDALNEAAKQALVAPRGNLSHGAGIGMGVLGADLLERLMEHPSPGTLAAVGLGYPVFAGLYSNAGRRLLNGPGAAMRSGAGGLLAPESGTIGGGLLGR